MESKKMRTKKTWNVIGFCLIAVTIVCTPMSLLYNTAENILKLGGHAKSPIAETMRLSCVAVLFDYSVTLVPTG